MKTNLDSIYRTDKQMESDGIWFNISEKTGFRIRRFDQNNPRIKAAMAKYYKPYAYQIQKDLIDPKTVQEILVKAFVHGGMADWRGVEIDGKDTPFTPEVAVEFFSELPDLFTTLYAYATDYGNFKEELGNSSPSA